MDLITSIRQLGSLHPLPPVVALAFTTLYKVQTYKTLTGVD